MTKPIKKTKTTKIAIEITDLFAGFDIKNPIIKSADLKVEISEFISITGSNGSGKSTLIRVILNLLKPFKGEVEIFGSKINTKIVSQYIGYLPQYHNIDKSFPITVKEVIELECHISGRSCKLDPKDHLSYFNSKHLINKKIGDLSGGELQKVYICRALVTDPEILILDEPTNNLDKQSIEQLNILLNDLNKSGKTIINITHNHSELLKQNKNFKHYLLSEGKINLCEHDH